MSLIPRVLVAIAGAAAVAAAEPIPSVIAVPPPPPTALETAVLRRGALAITSRVDVGTLARPNATGIEVSAVVVRFPDEQELPVRGVRVAVVSRLEAERPAPRVYVDLDECDGLVKGLATMLAKADEWRLKPVDRSDVSYTTRGGLGVSFIQGAKLQHGAIRVGEASAATFTVSLEELSQFRDLLAAAAANLNQP